MKPGEGFFTVRTPNADAQRVSYNFKYYDYWINEGGVLHITHYPKGYEEGSFGRKGGQRFMSLSPNGGYLSVQVVEE
jgi:hypothetical protein